MITFMKTQLRLTKTTYSQFISSNSYINITECNAVAKT